MNLCAADDLFINIKLIRGKKAEGTEGAFESQKSKKNGEYHGAHKQKI